MTSTKPISPSNGRAPATGFRWTKGRVAVAVWLVIMLGFWIYAFFLAPKGSPDILDDPAYAATAETRCAAARAFIATLPGARTAASATERAGVIDQADTELRTMLRDLRANVAGSTHDTKLLGLWLNDWDQFVTDRDEFAAELRVDPNASFGVTARGGSQISTAIDAFANRNKMTSCAIPDDV
jgi:hypothetical protein